MVFRPRSFTSIERGASRASVSREDTCRIAVESWLAQVSEEIVEEERGVDEEEVHLHFGTTIDAGELSSLPIHSSCRGLLA